MNKLILIGNLTREPELGETPSGISYCKMSIAVTRSYANQDGNRDTDFFDFTVWRNRAETCAQYLKKGSKVCIVGSIENRFYENEDGKRKITEVKCDEIEFLSSKKSEDAGEDKPRQRPQLEEIDDDSDLPF